MQLKQYEKLLEITLEKLNQAETEITLLKYDKEHLQMEIKKLREQRSEKLND